MPPAADEHGRGSLGVPLTVAAVVGAALWLAASSASGKREAWDASEYWNVAYPLALLTCAVLGYFYPRRSWLWALALFEAQFVGLCIWTREVGSLWPLGMVLFAVMSVPGMLAARVAVWLRARLAKETDSP